MKILQEIAIKEGLSWCEANHGAWFAPARGQTPARIVSVSIRARSDRLPCLLSAEDRKVGPGLR
jgi:hypothetical protein